MYGIFGIALVWNPITSDMNSSPTGIAPHSNNEANSFSFLIYFLSGSLIYCFNFSSFFAIRFHCFSGLAWRVCVCWVSLCARALFQRIQFVSILSFVRLSMDAVFFSRCFWLFKRKHFPSDSLFHSPSWLCNFFDFVVAALVLACHSHFSWLRARRSWSIFFPFCTRQRF